MTVATGCPSLTRGQAIRAGAAIVMGVVMFACSVGEAAGLLTPWPSWLLSAVAALCLCQLLCDDVGRVMAEARQERGP